VPRVAVVVLALAVAVLSAYAGYRLSLARAPAPAVESPEPVAATPAAITDPLAVRIDDLEGREHSLSEWRGKILVANFWGTWCPPCVVEIPEFVHLQREWGTRGLQFVGIALDDPAAVAAFVAEKGVNYPVLVGEDVVTDLMRALGNRVGGLPYTVVFDRTGQVVHVQQGEWKTAAARAVLEPLLTPP